MGFFERGGTMMKSFIRTTSLVLLRVVLLIAFMIEPVGLLLYGGWAIRLTAHHNWWWAAIGSLCAIGFLLLCIYNDSLYKIRRLLLPRRQL